MSFLNSLVSRNDSILNAPKKCPTGPFRTIFELIADPERTPHRISTIEAKLKECGVSYDFKSYPDAGHGFNCDDRGSYHEASAKDAWDRTVGFFGQHLPLNPNPVLTPFGT